MTEAALWNKLRPALKTLDPHRVENGLGCGTPDVNYAHGWMELKDVPNWPRDPAKPLIIRKLVERREQVPWLMKRWQAGGPAFLFIRVQHELLMFDGWNSRQVRSGLPQAELRDLACWKTAENGRVTEELARSLHSWLCFQPELMTPGDRAMWCRLTARWSREEVARDLKWSVDRVKAAEMGSADTDELLEFWES